MSPSDAINSVRPLLERMSPMPAVRMSPFPRDSGLFATPENIGELSQLTNKDVEPRKVEPHLWLERAPTLRELHMARRALLRDHRMPRDGVIVCSIPAGEPEIELVASLDHYRMFSFKLDTYVRETAKLQPVEQPVENEIGRIDGWRIVARPQ